MLFIWKSGLNSHFLYFITQKIFKKIYILANIIIVLLFPIATTCRSTWKEEAIIYVLHSFILENPGQKTEYHGWQYLPTALLLLIIHFNICNIYIYEFNSLYVGCRNLWQTIIWNCKLRYNWKMRNPGKQRLLQNNENICMIYSSWRDSGAVKNLPVSVILSQC